jgi:hypothetical protein
MELSEKNAKILMLEMHQDIEEYADQTVKEIFVKKEFDFLTYPPNCGLTDNEINELKKLADNSDLISGLRKIIADNSGGVLFNLFNLIDGTTNPKNDDNNEWTDLKLIDEEWDGKEEIVDDWLHDKFYATYWDWKDIRPEKDWQLDNV